MTRIPDDRRNGEGAHPHVPIMGARRDSGQVTVLPKSVESRAGQRYQITARRVRRIAPTAAY